MSPAGENVGQAWIGLGIESDATAELKRIEADVKRSMEKIDRMEATADIDANILQFKKDALYVKQEMARLDKLEATPEIKADKKALKELNAEIRNGTEALRIQKSEIAAATAAENRRTKSIDVAAAAERKREKVLTQAEAATRKMIGTQQRAIDMDQKRTIEVEKLRQSYSKMLGQSAKMNRAGLLGNAFDKSRLAQFNAELERTRSRIMDLGGDFTDLDAETERSNGRLGKMLTSLGSIRIQMGFLSGTLRQVATGFTVLGPVVFALGGQIAALVGVLGTGLLGALSVGGAFASGFALSLGGIIAIAKPLVGELTDAKKASDAYGDAVRKYGKGSTEAATAQEKLNQTLKDVSPEARKAFASIGTMGDRWNKLTEDAGRKSFFDLIGSGVRAANALMPMFARESVATFDVATAAAQKWTDAFSSSGARDGISQIMTGFREALPELNSGFLALGTAFGRISVSASKLLPMLTSGFSDWADKAMMGTSNGLDQRIERLVDHMRQVGQFAQSAGGMLATFFNAGANEGASLLSTLTQIFDRWNTWMSSAAGQSSLASFFSQANQLGSAFVGVLASMGVALFEFSQAFAPLSAGFIQVIGFTSQLVAAVMSFSGARAAITGLGAALATAFVAGKVVAFVSVLRGIPVAIGAIVAAARAGSLALLFTTPLGPALALAAAVVGVGVAIGTLISSGSSAVSTMDNLASSTESANNALNDIADAEMSSMEAKLQLRTATAALSAANKSYNQHIKDGTENTKAGKAALDAVNRAYLDRKRAVQDMKAADKQAANAWAKDWGTQEQEIADVQGAIKDLRKEKALATSEDPFTRNSQRPLEEINRELKEARANLRQMEKNAGEAGAAFTVFQDLNKIREGIALDPSIAGEWLKVSSAMSETAQTGLANMFQNMPAQAEKAISVTSKLIQQGAGKKAQQIILNPKLNDRQVLNQLQGLKKTVSTTVNAKVNKNQAERDLGRLGKGKTATISTKADTKAASRDLSRLSGRQLAARIRVTADDRDATGKLNAIERRKLKRKLFELGASPGAVLAAINMVEAKKLKTKSVKLEGKASVGAIETADKKIQGIRDKTAKLDATFDPAGVNEAKSAIASVPANKTSTITTVHKSVGAKAQGGTPEPRLNTGDPVIDNAYRSAREQTNRPGKYSRPTLLVGEERKDEYVIATNPAYRSANTGYLSMAANDLGYDLVEAAKKGKPKKALAPKGNQKAKLNPMYDQHRGRVSFYADQATYRETDRTQDLAAGRDPSFTPGNILGSYNQQMSSLETLERWITKHIASLERKSGLGKSKGSSDTEAAANRTVFKLENELKRHKAGRPKVQKDKDGVETKASVKRQAKWDKELSGLQSRLDKGKATAQSARGKTAQYSSEIGQYQRELENALPGEFNSLQNTIDRWADIVNGDIEDPTLAPTDSSGSASTPIGLQLATFDKDRYDILNSFGGNLQGSGPGGTGGAFAAAPNGGFASPASGPSVAPNGGFSTPGNVPAAGFGRSSFPPSQGSPGGAPAGGGGRTVVQNITMMEPPDDPHTFTQQMAWEAGAAY